MSRLEVKNGAARRRFRWSFWDWTVAAECVVVTAWAIGRIAGWW